MGRKADEVYVDLSLLAERHHFCCGVRDLAIEDEDPLRCGEGLCVSFEVFDVLEHQYIIGVTSV